MKDNIRVLIVDDSTLIRSILVDMLESVQGFQVVGEAEDGQQAVELAASLRPDVITMDIRMPRMNGLEATRQIMSVTPTPIVVVASSIYETDMNIAFNAVEMGALTVVEKPKGLDPTEYDNVRDQLVTALRLMSEVQMVTLAPVSHATPSFLQPGQEAAPRPAARVELIAMAASTGGPGTLRQILGGLPGDMNIPIVIVQHITPGFSQGFARWLDSATPLQVALAQDGEQAAPGRVLLAPEGAHMLVTPGGIVRLDSSAPINGQRPSATPLFDSVAQTCGTAAVGVILTGIGADGIAGLEILRWKGGQVIAQKEESCVVCDMPKAAIERGIADLILTPEEITQAIIRFNEYT